MEHRSPPKQMAGLIWTAVTLSLLLYVGNCQKPPAGPSLSQLKILVDKIWNNYMPSYEKNNKDHFPMFSLAVSIPYNNNNNDNKLKGYDVRGIPNTAGELKATLLRCEVYKGERMVAATVLKWPDVLLQCPKEPVQWKGVLPLKNSNLAMTWAQAKGVADTFTKADHAEYRTLTALNTLTNNLDKNDFMLFYVYASPCVSQCTSIDNDMSILEKIKDIKKWKNYALVFTNVFKAGGDQSDENERKAALKRLGESIGLDHIFRCNKNNEYQKRKDPQKEECLKCSLVVENEVNPFCYVDPPKPASSNNLPSTSSNQHPSGSGGVKGRRRRGIGNKGKKTNEGDGVSTNVDG